MRTISLHFYDVFLTKSNIPSQLFLSNKFRECVLRREIICNKTVGQLLKSWFLNATRVLVLKQQIFIKKNLCMAYGFISVTIPYCTIYYLLYQEFLIACAYPYDIAGSLINCFLVQLFLLTREFLLLNYSQLYQIFPNASVTIYYISCNSCFSFFLVQLFLFTLSISYQYLLLLLSSQYSYQNQLSLSRASISLVVVSATPLSHQHAVPAIRLSHHGVT